MLYLYQSSVCLVLHQLKLSRHDVHDEQRLQRRPKRTSDQDAHEEPVQVLARGRRVLGVAV